MLDREMVGCGDVVADAAIPAVALQAELCTQDGAVGLGTLQGRPLRAWSSSPDGTQCQNRSDAAGHRGAEARIQGKAAE